MTSLRESLQTCFVCGNSAVYILACSSRRYGPSDLDLRPPPATHFALQYWVHRCPHCGYCAPNIASGPDQARASMQSDAYVRQLDDPQYPELANRFLCSAIIHEQAGWLVEAAWAHVHAAWSCDDEGKDRAAARLRLRAAVLFQRLRAEGIPFTDPPGGEEALMADLLRRSGDPSGALALSREGLRTARDTTVRHVLHYVATLAERGDVRPHTVADALMTNAPG